MSFKIMTDTSANLPKEIIEKYDITVIPLSYYLDGEEFTETSIGDGTEYYGKIKNGAKVTTSQVTPQRYIDNFSPVLANGNDIMFIGMSSGISGTYYCAQIAAEELKDEFPCRRISLFDTLAASLGEGLLVLEAAKMRDAGADIDEIEEKLKKMRGKMYQIFTVDDLMHLKRGGRVSGTAAIIGTVLHIKPLLKGNEVGRIVTCGKVRGAKKSVEALAEKYNQLVESPENQTVGIAHAANPEAAEYLKTLLNSQKPPKEIITVCYEPVTGAHVGPGALALFFEGADGVRRE